MPIITNAFAQETATATTQAAASATGAPGILESMLPLVLIFVIFYFMLIRPQQKRLKAHQALVAALKKGDKVITNGGLIGTVYRVEEKENIVVLEVAPEVRVKITRNSIAEIKDGSAKTETKKTSKEAAEEEDNDDKKSSNSGHKNSEK
jgi:preprotein translocase subunit YajC